MSRPLVLVSCRVDTRVDIGESRDAVDQRLSHFLFEAGLLPVLIPNDATIASEAFKRLRPAGIVLSGGNDLVSLGGDRPERDEAEARLIESAVDMGRPVFGICRGMQFLCAREGGEVQPVTGHVRTRHEIIGPNSATRVVNSYHNFGVKNAPPGWKILGRATDETIEWMTSADRRLLGVMWHPEREDEFHADDLRMVHDHFRS